MSSKHSKKKATNCDVGELLFSECTWARHILPSTSCDVTESFCSISSQAVGDFENLQMLWDLTGPVWPNLKVLRCERPMPTAGQYFNSAATTRLWQKNVQVCRSFSSQPTALSLNSNYYCHSEGCSSTCFSCFSTALHFPRRYGSKTFQRSRWNSVDG